MPCTCCCGASLLTSSRTLSIWRSCASSCASTRGTRACSGAHGSATCSSAEPHCRAMWCDVHACCRPCWGVAMQGARAVESVCPPTLPLLVAMNPHVCESGRGAGCLRFRGDMRARRYVRARHLLHRPQPLGDPVRRGCAPAATRRGSSRRQCCTAVRSAAAPARCVPLIVLSAPLYLLSSRRITAESPGTKLCCLDADVVQCCARVLQTR